MSVMLFSSNEVYKTMSRSYEGLKGLAMRYSHRAFSQEDDYQFYKALRRLYFANVSCYLCQYHDDTPLASAELQAIETFSEIEGYSAPVRPDHEELVNQFLDAWRSLKYNLCTNDCELYKASDSYDYMEELAHCYRRALIFALLHAGQHR